MKILVAYILTGVLAIGFTIPAAYASLLGSPISLKTVVQTIKTDGPIVFCPFHTDDVLMGLILVTRC